MIVHDTVLHYINTTRAARPKPPAGGTGAGSCRAQRAHGPPKGTIVCIMFIVNIIVIMIYCYY